MIGDAPGDTDQDPGASEEAVPKSEGRAGLPVLAAAKIELSLTLKRLIACQNRLYRENGSYPDDLAAAIQRLKFLLGPEYSCTAFDWARSPSLMVCDPPYGISLGFERRNHA